MSYIKNSRQAVSYFKFRPSPPKELIDKTIDFLKDGIKTHFTYALDIGCGSGQSTEILAPFFQHVVGLDNSEDQLQHAQEHCKHKNVSYRSGSAERLEEADGQVDLVTVGMALHWFNLSQFLAEVSRVLKPGGALAVYGYYSPTVSIPGNNCASLAQTVELMFKDTLRDYTPDQSKLIYFDGYKAPQFYKFTFSKQPALRFEIPSVKKNSSIEDLVGYISTTSAYQNYIMRQGEAEAKILLSQFRERLGQQLQEITHTDSAALDIIFPYVLLLSRKDL